jgi:hypothetical protein
MLIFVYGCIYHNKKMQHYFFHNNHSNKKDMFLGLRCINND